MEIKVTHYVGRYLQLNSNVNGVVPVVGLGWIEIIFGKVRLYVNVMLVRLNNERKCSSAGRRQGHEKDQDFRETRLNAISAASFRELCLCESLTLHEVVGHVTTEHVADHVHITGSCYWR